MHLTAGQLREILLNEFTESEVEALCAKLGIEYARLSGTGHFGKTRELLAIVLKQDRLSHLRAHMRAMRPNAFDAFQDADADAEGENVSTGDARRRSERATQRSEAVPPHTKGRMPITDEADDAEGDEDVQDAEIDPYFNDRTDDSGDMQRPRVGNTQKYTEFLEEEEKDEEEEDIVDPETVRRRPGSGSRVSRETARTYEIVPQTRGLVPLLIVAVVIVIAAVVVYLPRLIRSESTTATPVAPTNAPPPPTQTSSIPVINQAAPTPAIPSPQAPQNNPAGAVVIATPAPIADAGATAAAPTTNAVPTVPVIATPQSDPAVNGETHPAARLVQDANLALPAYFRGQATEDSIAASWTGKAYDITAAWNAALPKAVRLGNAPRSTLTIDFEFVRPPAVATSRGDLHSVSTREYWAYRNPATNTSLCDTRDYLYTVREINGRFLIENVTSKIIDKQCR